VNKDHQEILRKGADHWNAWRKEDASIVPDLRRADLREFTPAHYNLRNADCKGINLNRANVYRSDLSGARLHRANLIGTVINQTRLDDAILTKARCGGTVFSDLDLSSVHGLQDVVHRRSSTIGIDTLLRSRADLPLSFLRGVGLSDETIDAMQSVAGTTFFSSAFISYSHADHAFATALHDKLQEKGIRCWLDRHDLMPGEPILDTVNEAINHHDKVLLCCSAASLRSTWVEDEIAIAFEKERTYGSLVLIPLNLDGSLFGWSSGKAVRIRERSAADFIDWENDPDKFDSQVDVLSNALRIKR